MILWGDMDSPRDEAVNRIGEGSAAIISPMILLWLILEISV